MDEINPFAQRLRRRKFTIDIIFAANRNFPPSAFSEWVGDAPSFSAQNRGRNPPRWKGTHGAIFHKGFVTTLQIKDRLAIEMRYLLLTYTSVVLAACSTPAAQDPGAPGDRTLRSQSHEKGKDVDRLRQEAKSVEQQIREVMERLVRPSSSEKGTMEMVNVAKGAFIIPFEPRVVIEADISGRGFSPDRLTHCRVTVKNTFIASVWPRHDHEDNEAIFLIMAEEAKKQFWEYAQRGESIAVEADPEVPFGVVLSAVDALKKKGFVNIKLANHKEAEKRRWKRP